MKANFAKPLSKSETFYRAPCVRRRRSGSRNQPEKASALDSNS